MGWYLFHGTVLWTIAKILYYYYLNCLILIDKALLEKYRKGPQKSTPFDEQDYEDVRMQEDTCFDYDEPIPHSKVVSELL